MQLNCRIVESICPNIERSGFLSLRMDYNILYKLHPSRDEWVTKSEFGMHHTDYPQSDQKLKWILKTMIIHANLQYFLS